jgi:hypothetical protein
MIADSTAGGVGPRVEHTGCETEQGFPSKAFRAFMGRRGCGDPLCCADLLCYAEQEANVFARQRTRSSKITLRTRTGCETEQGIPKQYWSRSSSAFDMRIETLGDTPLPRRAKALRAMIASYTATHLPYGLPWTLEYCDEAARTSTARGKPSGPSTPATLPGSHCERSDVHSSMSGVIQARPRAYNCDKKRGGDHGTGYTWD